KKNQVLTESKDLDFTHFSSFVRLNSGDTISYNVQNRPGKSPWNSLIIRCRKKDGAPALYIHAGAASKKIKISGESWNEIEVDLRKLNPFKNKNWRFELQGGSADIDRLEWHTK